MSNEYPQVAVLGCDSRKANLYYDLDRRAWVEHLASPCVNNEQSILEFCQQVYPSLRIGNIVRLDTVLRFEDWCELTSPIDKNGNNIHRCKKVNGKEETVQSFRCLFMNSDRQAINLPSNDCSINSIIGSGECYRSEKWQELASEQCLNKSMTLTDSVMTMDWCGLSLFRGIEFVCCPKKKISDNDYETIVDEQDDDSLLEDDQIADSNSNNRRIIATNLASREPSWLDDYRRWSSDPAYFADDEEANDDQPLATSEERNRFNKAKEDFKLNFKNQIDQLRSRWQQRQIDAQTSIVRDANELEQEQNRIEKDFREQYESIKQTANLERTKLNEVHENNLEILMNKARNEANKKLNQAWNERPLKTERIQDALYNYLQILLRDRIHLVNRYERLKAVDPNQAEKKRVSIHERLRLIVDRISDALTQLNQNENLRAKIQPRIDKLFGEFSEVNQAADKLLSDYQSSLPKSSTTQKSRILPLGRDAAKIYPFRSTSSPTTTVSSDETNNEYDYATNDEYDEDDDDNETDLSLSTSTRTTVSSLNENDSVNYDQGESDWDTRNENDENEKNDSVFDDDLIIDDQNQQAFINENDDRSSESTKRPVRHYLVTYLPYGIGCLFLVCVFVGLLIFRFIRNNRAYGNQYEKNYVFTEVDCCTPDEKALHALQMNGYENPTYKYFESQTGKC